MTDANTVAWMNGLVVVGAAVTAALWVAVSAFAVLNRLLYDRRERRLMNITRALTDPEVARLPPLERSPAIERVLALLPRRVIYALVATTAYPAWVTEVCAAYSLEYPGLPRMMRDAAAGARRRRWRRISALFALGHLRVAGIHELLRAAVSDRDADVSAAAMVVLTRLGDRTAAEILVAALQRTHSPSRVATHLDLFPIPVDDLLRPLLRDERPRTRYWAASLLNRYPASPGLSDDIGSLVDDADASVRKVALLTLTAAAGSAAMPHVRRALADPVPYVRSTAIRMIAAQGVLEGEVARRAHASWIASSLADCQWEVRLAAREALTELGPTVWREAAAQLESADPFARNTAAEVLQNMGVLDMAIAMVERGEPLGEELEQAVGLAFREGGPAMISAAAGRTDAARVLAAVKPAHTSLTPWTART